MEQKKQIFEKEKYIRPFFMGETIGTIVHVERPRCSVITFYLDADTPPFHLKINMPWLKAQFFEIDKLKPGDRAYFLIFRRKYHYVHEAWANPKWVRPDGTTYLA